MNPHTHRLLSRVAAVCEAYLEGRVMPQVVQGVADATIGALEADSDPRIKAALNTLVNSLEDVFYTFDEVDQSREIKKHVLKWLAESRLLGWSPKLVDDSQNGGLDLDL